MPEADKQRNLIFDDYADRFYFETKVEALERLSKQRDKHACTQNRSGSKKLEFEHQQIHSAQHIFESKFYREVHAARESLKDMVSYKHALNKIARTNSSNQSQQDQNMGKYGLDVSYFKMEDERNQAKKDMRYETRRKVKAKQLLENRKPMFVLDRTKTTDHLLQNWRAEVTGESKQDQVKNKKGFVLPPLQVKKPVSNGRAVFITQQGYYS